MNNTDKILAEFNERFNKPLRSDINKFINREGDIHTYLDLSDIKSFLTTKIAQALAEERERVVVEEKIYGIAVEVIGDMDKPKEIAIYITMENSFKTIKYVPTVQLIPGSFGFRYEGRDLTNKDDLLSSLDTNPK